MTGFNHYRSCTCGWCVNSGRSRLSRRDVASDMYRSAAESILKANGARSAAGCFVNPNARCPVCGASVFFYSNGRGSRVFFDDLGPPWPKHPCTDRAPTGPGWTPPASGPSRRPRGITIELLEASHTAGYARSSQLGYRHPDEWHLLILADVRREGEVNHLLAEVLNSDSAETMTFDCRSAEPLFQVGDFISLRQGVFSFLHPIELLPAQFKNGEQVRMSPEAARANNLPPAAALAGPVGLMRVSLNHPLHESEEQHFNSKKVPLRALCERLGPVVAALAKRGIRHPMQVAKRLNRGGHRTAAGATWTPRLAHYLIRLVSPEDESVDTGGVKETAKAATRQLDMTAKGIAHRLSSLGKVTVTRR